MHYESKEKKIPKGKAGQINQQRETAPTRVALSQYSKDLIFNWF